MRTILAVLLAITILVIGITAISNSAQQSEATALNSSNASSDAYNLSTSVYDGIGNAASGALVYGGIGAIVLVSLGFLVAAGNRGGR